MNYKRIYSAIIKNRLINPLSESEYGQKHHILPKSLFPDKENDSDNIVKLSYREHYICHWLLTKIYSCKEMIFAFWMMNHCKNESYINSHAFQVSRKEFCESFKGQKNPFYRKHHSEETKRKMSELKKGKYTGQKNPNFGKHHSDEVRKKCGEVNKGRKMSEESKQKNRDAHLGKILVNNGIIAKWVYPDEIPDGFIKGRLKK